MFPILLEGRMTTWLPRDGSRHRTGKEIRFGRSRKRPYASTFPPASWGIQVPKSGRSPRDGDGQARGLYRRPTLSGLGQRLKEMIPSWRGDPLRFLLDPAVSLFFE